MSEEPEDAVAAFLDAADKVYSEYDQGYMNADVALSQLETRIETLRESVEE
ncbi:hypothetical protein SY89_01319 [Halolamina pelagica]|uniref:Uncharacterized protein n=1 Tax=Halolamina pelagica TaxID=699431 RepID=A0A0P7GP63_9EURY|nr:hypothetical protein [Halolamina pelagica]KPN30584.1 hypothetical protein SY89_01319 [Halolamina pelagica]